MLQPLLHIIRKEFIHIKRDKLSLAMAFLVPILLLIIFGYALTSNLTSIHLGILNEDGGGESLDLINNFQAAGAFEVEILDGSRTIISNLLDGGVLTAVLIIPDNFGASQRQGAGAETILVVDGVDPFKANTAMTWIQLVLNSYSTQLITQTIPVSSNLPIHTDFGMPTIAIKKEVWYNPQLQSAVYNIPGLFGLIMQNVTIMLTAFTLVREREQGTMEQLLVTPITPGMLILGKVIPYIIIGIIDFCLILLLGSVWFDITIRGSLFLLLMLASLFLLCALLVGMFFSAIAKTQLQAMQMAVLFILPSVILSGFVFSRDSMPILAQWIGALIPLTYFLEIIRGIILKGVGITFLMKDALILGLFTLVTVLISCYLFPKTLD